MGINTLGQLAKADVHKLREKFGANGRWMWKVAIGTDEESVTPRGDHVSLSTESTLDRHTRNERQVVDLINNLIDEIYLRAQRQGYLFQTVGVKLVRTDFTIETRETPYEYFQG